MDYYEAAASRSRLPVGIQSAPAWAAIDLAALLLLNIRLDYLRVEGYLRDHWRYWLSWTALVAGLQAAFALDPRPRALLEPGKYWFFGLAWLYYYFGNWLLLGPLHGKVLPRDRARALQAYEFAVSTMWLGIQLSLQLLCLAARSDAAFASIPETLTTGAGAALIVAGYAGKGWAAWLVGMDSYFLRDLFLDIPNERLVSSGIYRFFKHPTYSVGYLQGYGFAVLNRSAPGLAAAAAAHIGIFLFVKLCEEPGMRRLYGQGLRVDSSS